MSLNKETKPNLTTIYLNKKQTNKYSTFPNQNRQYETSNVDI